jgi:hypothetical protein
MAAYYTRDSLHYQEVLELFPSWQKEKTVKSQKSEVNECILPLAQCAVYQKVTKVRHHIYADTVTK